MTTNPADRTPVAVITLPEGRPEAPLSFTGTPLDDKTQHEDQWLLPPKITSVSNGRGLVSVASATRPDIGGVAAVEKHDRTLTVHFLVISNRMQVQMVKRWIELMITSAIEDAVAELALTELPTDGHVH